MNRIFELGPAQILQAGVAFYMNTDFIPDALLRSQATLILILG
jgi:hypothetical protein